jgi:hypothetical protein
VRAARFFGAAARSARFASMRWLVVVCALALPAVAEEHRVAVGPIDGVLARADAAALEDAVRVEARGVDLPVVAGAPASAASAAELGATHAIFGKAVRLEGALAVMLTLVKADGGARLGTERLVGFTLADLQGEAKKKVPRLLRAGLGMAEPAPPAPLSRTAAASVAPATPRPDPLPLPPAAPARTATSVTQPAAVSSAAPAPVATPAPPKPKGPRFVRAPTNVTGANEGSPIVRTIREVVEDVEDVRGLWRKTTLQIVLLDDALFSKALGTKAQKELTRAAVASERARWAAFGLAPPDADPAKILLGVLDEQVAGFYDPDTKTLTVREKPPASAGTASDAFELVIAHEVEHALQDQHFGFPDMAKLPDDDARLARMALYEGDAMATMIAVGARRAGRPVKLALGMAAAAARAMSPAQLAQTAGYSPELLRAPAVVREELALPYVAGLALVAEVHHRGGFELVDKMFERPPASTHHVLHPDAYFAGEQPARVPYPPPPPGMQILATGRMGELGARLALQVCVDEEVARDFARHWAGDAYTIVRGPTDGVSLVWSTAWSGEGAKQFGTLLGMQSPCWQEAAEAYKGKPYAIAAAAEVRIDGVKVALARGLPQQALGSAAAAATRFDGKPAPPAPPLGAVRSDEQDEHARVADGRFVSPRLGIEADVPPGFEADVDQPAAEIVLRKPRPEAQASLLFVPERATPEVVDAFFQTAATAFANEVGGSSLKLRAAQRTTLFGSAAQERAWDVQGTQAVLRATVAPACGGKGYYAVLRAAADEASRAALERFVGSLKKNGADASPACAELQ